MAGQRIKLSASPASVNRAPSNPKLEDEATAPEVLPEVDVELAPDEVDVEFVPLIAIALAWNAAKSLGSTAFTLKTMPCPQWPV